MKPLCQSPPIQRASDQLRKKPRSVRRTRARVRSGGGFIPALAALLLLGACTPTPAVAACAITGEGTPADIALARDACQRASERFALLYGAPPPRGTIEVSDTAAFAGIEEYGPEWKLVWPSSERMRGFFGASGADDRALDDELELQWSTVLPHELGHVMLIAESDARREAGMAAERRRLPDWLHEGTAVWMEPPVYRADSESTLRALQPYVPPLDEVLTFTVSVGGERLGAGSTLIQTFFPCASEIACGGRTHWSRIFSVTTRQFPDGRMEVDTTFHEVAPPPPSPLASHFYVYANHLVRHLHQQGGPAAMSALLDRVLRSPDGTFTLHGLPSLARDRVGVERDWRGYFERWIFPAGAPG